MRRLDSRHRTAGRPDRATPDAIAPRHRRHRATRRTASLRGVRPSMDRLMKHGSSRGLGRFARPALLSFCALGMFSIAGCDDPASPASADASSELLTERRHDAAHRDDSPHREGFVTRGDVTLHYLDWGGKGPTLVLLPGLGDNAHIYD